MCLSCLPLISAEMQLLPLLIENGIVNSVDSIEALLVTLIELEHPKSSFIRNEKAKCCQIVSPALPKETLSALEDYPL